MRTTQDYGPSERYDQPPPNTGYGEEPSGQGWVLFAAIMMGLLGVWNFFEGIAAISSARLTDSWPLTSAKSSSSSDT